MKSNAVFRSLLTFPLGGGNVDRMEAERKAKGFLAERLKADASPCVVVCKMDRRRGYTTSVYVSDKASPETSWLLPLQAETGKPIRDLSRAVFVGKDGDSQRSVFVTALENVEPAALAAGAWVNSKRLSDKLSRTQLALLGVSIAMHNWPMAEKCCSKCGGKLKLHHYGMAQRCTGCRALHFPRINPAMIACVLDGKGNVLLSQRSKPKPGSKKMLTILSGFVSYGESVEDCVVREVAEESQAKVTYVRYVGSQPWPYPYQLMLGYYAVAESSPKLVVEDSELLSVSWVSKAAVRSAIAGTNNFIVPEESSTAGVLLREWVNGRVNDHGDATTSKL